MNEPKALKIDVEDLEDLIIKIEDSFEIGFVEHEIPNETTIDKLSEIVLSKLHMDEGSECSSQVVFYRLRQFLINRKNLSKKEINLDTKLEDLFPSNGRKKAWVITFKEFGIAVPKLEPNMSILLSFVLIAIISSFFIFGEYWYYGWPFFTSSTFGIFLLNKYGKSLPSQTIGEFVKRIVKEKHTSVRKEIGSINSKEMKNIIYEILTDWIDEDERKYIGFNSKIVFDN